MPFGIRGTAQAGDWTQENERKREVEVMKVGSREGKGSFTRNNTWESNQNRYSKAVNGKDDDKIRNNI